MRSAYGSLITLLLTAAFLIGSVSMAVPQEKEKEEELKKASGKIGWVTLDRVTLVLMVPKKGPVKAGELSQEPVELVIPPDAKVKLIKMVPADGVFTDLLSGRTISLTYVEEGGKRVVREMTVTVPPPRRAGEAGGE